MREHADKPRDPGFVAFGIARMLPPKVQDDPIAMDALALLVGAIFKLTRHEG